MPSALPLPYRAVGESPTSRTVRQSVERGLRWGPDTGPLGTTPQALTLGRFRESWDKTDHAVAQLPCFCLVNVASPGRPG